MIEENKMSMYSDLNLSLKHPQMVPICQLEKYIFIPVNGEEFFNDVGLSHGGVHFMCPNTGKVIGHCGIHHFEKNVKVIGWKIIS